MTGETAAAATQEQEKTPDFRRMFRVEAVAQGKEGAVKLMVFMSGQPTEDHLAKMRARVSAQYRVQYDAWGNAPTASFTPPAVSTPGVGA
jgi:hypothetical protein